ncbi:MAG: threonine/serine exporter family protein [Candidatus Zixiibacteriota bacterium]
MTATTAPDIAAAQFATKLARLLHRYGAPAHRLEEAMELVAHRLGVEGQFFATPTAVFASLGKGEDQRTYLLRTEPADVDLGKLAMLDGVIGEIAAGRVSVSEADSRVDAILDTRAPYGAALTTLCFALASGTAARFFGGGWREIATATVIGLVIGLLALLAVRLRVIARVFEPLAATLASIMAIGMVAYLPPSSAYIATLGGLIVLVPGLTLTIAMNELATRHLASGTARLSGAFVLFLSIGFGVALGTRIGSALFAKPEFVDPVALPVWTQWVALAIAPLTFAVLFKARPSDIWAILVAGIVAFGGARLGTTVMGPELGVFLGALLVGIVGNLYARVMNRSAAVPLVPGIMLLVPGGIGFKSLSSLLAGDVVSSVETIFLMTLIAIALVTGLLVANVVLPPGRAL